MESKDIIAICVSSMALLISSLAFYFSLKQRIEENARVLRKSLTDTIDELVKISIAFVGVKKEDLPNKDRVLLRRLYNSQRRYLSDHAEFIANKIPGLVMDIDCNVIAGAYEAIGDSDKAAIYWEKCVRLTSSPVIKMQNLRGYAHLLYNSGRFEEGRNAFSESLLVKVGDTDNMRRMKADTYVMQARLELMHGFVEEAKRFREQAISATRRIANKDLQKDMLERIEDELEIDSIEQEAS